MSLKLFKNHSWYDSYSSTHENPNKKALNFARIYLSLSSIISIVLLQFVPNYSESFKIFLNLFWYPSVNIGLTTSGFIIGYDFYTKYHISWKNWIKNFKEYYLSYYFYAFLIIIVGLISFAIIQNTGNLELYKSQNSNNLLYEINYGWSNNSNNWYGFIFLYSLIPTQNFYILGTTFVVTFFFFILLAPFIFNFMNKIKYSNCTIFVFALGFISCFLSTWSSLFNSIPQFRNNLPWFQNVNMFTNWIQISFLFIFGFYIRKYTKIIPWKIALTIFIILVISFFSIETTLDFVLKDLGKNINLPNNFNVFYLGAGICTIPIIILSYLFLNICAQYKSYKMPSSFVNKMNVFNEKNQKYIPDQFMLVGISTRMIYGILFLKIILNQDVYINNNETLILGEAINKNWWGWSLLPTSIVVTLIIYGTTYLRKKLFIFLKQMCLKCKKIN